MVSRAFREARAAATRYAGLRVVAAFATSFDAAAYRSQERDVAQFRRDMALLRCELRSVVRIRAQAGKKALYIRLIRGIV